MDEILLDHYGHLTNEEIEKLKNDFTDLNIKLREYNRSGKLFATVDSYLTTFFVIDAATIVSWSLNGVSWDIFKMILNYSFEKLKDTTLTKMRSQNSNPVTRPNNFGIKIRFERGKLESIEYNGQEENLKEILNTIEKINNNNNNYRYKIEELKKK